MRVGRQSAVQTNIPDDAMAEVEREAAQTGKSRYAVLRGIIIEWARERAARAAEVEAGRERRQGE